MRRSCRSGLESGFTLIELIIVIVLLGILAVVGANMLSDSFTTTRMVNAGNASESEARYALERLAREIREVKRASSSVSPTTYCSGTITDQYCITTPSTLPASLTLVNTSGATGSSLVFVNGASGNNITIGANGKNLTLNGFVLCGNVTNLTFTFLDGNGGTSPTVATVTFVVIDLTVQDTVSNLSLSQRVRVVLRNA